MRKAANSLYSYRVMRPIYHKGQILGIGQLIELPREIGANLMTVGRVEPLDAEQFDDAEVAPAFCIGRPGITQR
jgi:hypothetical protein